ncbi:Na+/H+ antiporter subunit E [Actinomadura gamaensis]|uniref:Na+/H+ antiporter subunit E n=1 Tax=Actinomadura gamaensis TaxID=1763541 RepID=A0ABV9U9L3_9ACTN
MAAQQGRMQPGRSRRGPIRWPDSPRELLARVAGPAAWTFLAWILLTWKFTAEQLLVGVAVAVAAGLLLAPLGRAGGPWELLRPGRPRAAAELLGHTAWWIVVANVRLARRIWAPSRPLRSGMVVVPTRERTDAGLTAVALVTSVIVDNQLVDLDARRGLLQYHAVAVPDRPETINERVERILERTHREPGQEGEAGS